MRRVHGSPMPEKVTSLPDQLEAVLTEDALLGGKIRLQQPKEGFRAAIDTVFLAAAVPAKAGQRVLETGTGSGAAALCLAHRIDGVQITGIDVNPKMISLADSNIHLNQMVEKIYVTVGNVADRLPEGFDASFDHVMMNPPYLPDTSTHVSPNPDKALATMEAGADLERWLKYGHDALRNKGYLTVIHRADRVDEVIQSLSPNMGGVVVFPLWPRTGEDAKRVIIQARKGVRSPARILPGLVIHEADGRYTEAAAAVLKGTSLAL
jgi:tRNA1(Val) A37 N6-methylase TrmN6